MLPAILCLALLPTLCLSSGSVDVYLYPPAPSRPQPNGLAFLAYHLGLEAYSVQESTGQIQLGAARPFVGEGRRDTLVVSVDANHPSDVMPQALQPSFVLPLSIGSTSSLIQQYINLSLKTYHSVADSTTPSQHQSLRILDIFALSSVSSPLKSEAIQKFLESLKNVVAFVEESQPSGNADRFGAFELNGLKDIEEEWGQESEQYLTAAATLKAIIQSAVANELSLAVLLPSPLRTRQVTQPSQSPFPPPKKIPATAPVFSTSTCFTSADMCRNATATCSSRGDCVGVTRAGRTCFVCECRKAPLEEGGKNVSWAGNMCQKKDISQQFTLIVGTVIFLVLISVGSISLLYTIGSQELPGTLIGGLGGPSKRE